MGRDCPSMRTICAMWRWHGRGCRFNSLVVSPCLTCNIAWRLPCNAGMDMSALAGMMGGMGGTCGLHAAAAAAWQLILLCAYLSWGPGSQ